MADNKNNQSYEEDESVPYSLHFFPTALCLSCFQRQTFALPVVEREFESKVDEQFDEFSCKIIVIL